MADETQWEAVDAPPWAQQQPAWEPVEAPSWAPKPTKSVAQRTGEAIVEPLKAGWESATRMFRPPSKEEAEKYKGISGVGRSLAETGSDILNVVSAIPGAIIGAGAAPVASGVSEAARRVTGGDPARSEEMYEYAKPMAEAALSTVGRVPGIAGAGKAPMPDPILPRTTKVPRKDIEGEAGRYLEAQSDDPAALRSKLAAPDREIIPGHQPTTYQLTGDEGLGQVERGAARRPEMTEEFIRQRNAQNAARVRALEGMQPTGDPMQVARELRAVMEVDTLAGDRAAAEAAMRAQRAVEQLGGTNAPEVYGNIFRRELELAEERVRAAERARWNAVDPDGTLMSNPLPIQVLERQIYGPGGLTETAAASLTTSENQIGGLIQSYRPAIRFRELTDLRSLVSSALRQELYTNGQTPAYARLSRLRQGIEDAIPQSFNAEGEIAAGIQQRLREASAATAARAATFRPTRGITRKEGVSGPYKMEDVGAIPEKIIASGAKGYDRASQYLRAVGSERGLPELTDAIAARARREAIAPDGSINPRKLEGFLRRYQDTLRAIDERDGGVFSQRLRNLQTAQGELEAATTRQADLAKAQANDQFRAIIGAQDDQTATNLIAGLLGKADSPQRMAELMRRLSPQGREGARNAIVRHIQERLTRNAMPGEDPELRASQFRYFVQNNRAALRQALTPEQMTNLENIANSLIQASRSYKTKAIGGGSDSYQNFVQGSTQQSVFRQIAAKYGPAAARAAAHVIAGSMFGLPAVGASLVTEVTAHAIGAKRAAAAAKRIADVQRLIDEAMLDPSKAENLLGKALTYKSKTPGAKTATGYVAGAIGETVDENDQRRKRTAREAGGGVPAIGGTGGRSPGKTTPAGAREARQGAGQALADGGKAGNAEADPWGILNYAGGGEVKPGTREHFAQLLGGSPGGQDFASLMASSSKKSKAPSALSREDVVEYLKKRGVSGDESGWERMPSLQGGGEVPPAPPPPDAPDVPDVPDVPDASTTDVTIEGAPGAADTGLPDPIEGRRKKSIFGLPQFAEGGEVEDDSLLGDKPLPLPGQSRGLRSTAGPTVTSTMREEDIPPPVTNKAGETLPTYILKEWGKGLVGLPERATHAAGELQRQGDVYDPGPALETAMTMWGVRSPFMRQGDLGIFGGRGARTANLDMLKRAEQMHAEGVPKESIRNQTGWFLGPEGKWRFEISDVGSHVKPTERIYPPEHSGAASRPSGYRTGTMEEVFHHPELYRAYPQFKDMPATVELAEGIRPGGGFVPPHPLVRGDVGSIEVRAPYASEEAGNLSARRIMLHELQHGVQGQEGFAPGGNPNVLPFTERQITNITKKKAEEAGIPWSTIDPLERKKLKSATRQTVYEGYAGEVEARNVEARRDLPPGTGRAPWQTESVPREQQLIPIEGPRTRGQKPFRSPAVQRAEYASEPAAVGLFAPRGGGANPGIYKDPRQIVREAREKLAPEHPALHQLFNVHRQDLYDISQQGRRPGNLPDPAWVAQPERARGSAAAEGVMNPENARRILDTMAEAQKYPELLHGTDAWYVMDPAYQRLEYLHGPELAKRLYNRLNTTGAMASPASDVISEIRRGTAANMMAHQGRFPAWLEWAGTAEKDRPGFGRAFPPELRDVPGHLAHRTAHGLPIQGYLESGAVNMGSAKVPMYIPASGVPQTGFQTRWMVPDAHISKSLGMPDVRTPGTVRQGASMSMPEYRQVGPWYRENIAQPLGIEAVPAQARQWSVFAPQTGVRTLVGAPKLELLSQRIWERALRRGWDPKVLRDYVLSGGAHAGLAGGIFVPALMSQYGDQEEASPASAEARGRTRSPQNRSSQR